MRHMRKCCIRLSEVRYRTEEKVQKDGGTVMRGKMRRIRCFFLWLCVAALLAGCRELEKKEEKKSLRIGVSLYRGDDTFINNIRSELESCAKEFEQEKGIKVTLDIQDAKGSQNTQNNQVERFISLGCDVMCINPVDRTAASAMIDNSVIGGLSGKK